jgi:excinuclease ABC subunit C
MLVRPAAIPAESGCYLFRDERGVVVYVGKARSLAQRLPNYFQKPGVLDFKTGPLMEVAASVEWVVTGSEVDALILENELIKTHQPRFNIRLKDDKTFPFLALDRRGEWPHPYVTRGAHVKGVSYYGPFARVRPLRHTLEELLIVYPIRSCTNSKFDDHRRRGRPCLLYDVGKCCAPCVGRADPEEYREKVEGFAAFFEGHVDDLRDRLELRMTEAATHQRYEDAANSRDALLALDRAAESQRIVLDDHSDLDALAAVASGSRAAVTCHRVRKGRVIGRHQLLMDLAYDDNLTDVLERAVVELYSSDLDIPSLILCDVPDADGVLTKFLERFRGRPVQWRQPLRGKRRHLLEMVASDAVGVLEADSVRRTHDHNIRSRALTDLGVALGLPRPPFRIECFDMSHLQGTNYVGSMVVFVDGLPQKADYRRFAVRGVLGNDDVGAMTDVVGRRLDHWGETGGKFTNADLVILDGGLPQLHAGEAAAAERKLTGQVEFAALAKREELLFRPGSSQPIALEPGSEALYLVQRVRDEAHRFAITFHRSKRGKAMVRSVLDGVPGLGAKRAELVLTHFGSLDNLRLASVAEIATVPSLPESVARSLYDHLHPAATVRLTKEPAP